MDRTAISVEIAVSATAELLEAFQRLLPQLSRSASIVTSERLEQILGMRSNTVFVARSAAAGRIVGTLTLVQMHILTGVRAWIEDVVVDSAARGSGIGEALLTAAIAHARSVGARTVDLTSSPARAAAHRLYEKAGFEIRDTRVYRYLP
jgi:ribosomal protein S18 acetylase RimI-like enzyme